MRRSLPKPPVRGDQTILESPPAAIKLEPNDAYALYARGLAELRKGSSMRGHSDLSAALRLQPGIARPYASMGLTP